MSRFWILAAGGVVAVAALKTGLMVSFVLVPGQADLAIVTGLFALFTALTAGVAYLCYTQIRAALDRQRKDRLAPGQSEPVGREDVVQRYAQEWDLSKSEADVAIFVAKGFSNQEIAEMRGSAVSTVKSQLSSIYAKSGLGSRYQLMAFVTDELCAKATEDAPRGKAQIDTRKILPLVGKSRRAPATLPTDVALKIAAE